MTDYDVIICGLGPVGQLLALLLGDRGVRTLAFDREPEPYPLPRAAVIDDEVLRIFQSVGLDEAVLADAQVQPGASIVTAAGRPVEIVPHARRAGSATRRSSRSTSRRWSARCSPRSSTGRASTCAGADARGARPARRPRRRLRAARPDGGPSERISRALAGRLRRRRAARSARGSRSRSSGRTFPQRWVVVDALVDRPLRKVPHPHFVGDATPPDGDAADVARPPPLGVDAAPGRGRRAAPRAGRRPARGRRRGSTARRSRSSARSSTRSTRAWPPAGAAAACCSPATRRT